MVFLCVAFTNLYFFHLKFVHHFITIRTEICAFSEYRIYPGHGIKLVRRDGQPVLVGTSKSKSMVLQGKKPGKLQWTQCWRRMNKKGKDDIGGRKKARKTVRVQRGIVGLSVDDLKTRRKVGIAKPKVTEEAKKEIRDRKAATKKANKAQGGKQGGNVPKLQAKHK